MRNFQIGPRIVSNWTVATAEHCATWNPFISVENFHLNFYWLVFADFSSDCRCKCKVTFSRSVHTIVLPCQCHVPMVFLSLKVYCYMCFELTLYHPGWFTGYRWMCEIPYRITGFMSQSGRIMCFEVQVWFLLAGMSWQMVRVTCGWENVAVVKITGLEALIPQICSYCSLVPKRD